eukprot:TRINITY_DN23956_c0_g1_i1.p2 TRINITY_DN23956_c0_g1~~TRINITY_DN23956_c0_g1_i1.p2  ORF type:complete len:143 (+),score=63.07 TRINITY_DN23956_c0_g1_i1:38-466(+)
MSRRSPALSAKGLPAEVELQQQRELLIPEEDSAPSSPPPRPHSVAEAEARLRRRQRYARYRAPPPPKTTFAAALMLIGGSALSLAGAALWLLEPAERERAYALLLIGGILFLPGSYASVNIFGAYMGWPGYSYDAIPSYDDD